MLHQAMKNPGKPIIQLSITLVMAEAPFHKNHTG